MPITLPENRFEFDRYMIMAGKTTFTTTFTNNQEGWQRYIVLFLKGEFTKEEANKFALAAFDDMEVIPREEEYFHQGFVKVESMGISSPNYSSLPELFQHLIGDYPINEYIDCYDWHMLYYYSKRCLSVDADE